MRLARPRLPAPTARAQRASRKPHPSVAELGHPANATDATNAANAPHNNAEAAVAMVTPVYFSVATPIQSPSPANLWHTRGKTGLRPNGRIALCCSPRAVLDAFCVKLRNQPLCSHRVRPEVTFATDINNSDMKKFLILLTSIAAAVATSYAVHTKLESSECCAAGCAADSCECVNCESCSDCSCEACPCCEK
jgi:cell wall-associated NlpC family hydrolase